MRIAALYDIHANAPALHAVLAEVAAEDVDCIVIGGDVVPGPLPAETLGLLEMLGDRAVFVRGNGDRWVVDAFDRGESAAVEEEHPGRRAAAWTAAQMESGQRDFLASFSSTVSFDVDGLGRTLFCHGSPRSDEEILTAITPERRWRPALEGVEERVVMCGHTHAQFDRSLGPWRVVNAGAVGMPYEGRAGAYWVLLGPDVEHRRTEYDITAALPQLRAGGWPDLDEFLEESFLNPVSATEVAQFFESQADAPAPN
jgi:predicted phosphodiesterase